MRKQLFCRIYCELIFVSTLILIFYPIKDIYTDPIFYLKVCSLTAAACLLLSGTIFTLYLLIRKENFTLPRHRSQVILFVVEFSILMSALLFSTVNQNDSLILNAVFPLIAFWAAISFFLLRMARDFNSSAALKRNVASSATLLIALILFTLGIRQAISIMPYKYTTKIYENYYVKNVAPGGAEGPPQRTPQIKKYHFRTGPDIVEIVLLALVCLIVLILLFLFIRMTIRYLRSLKKNEVKNGLYDENYEFIQIKTSVSAPKKRNILSQGYRGTVRAFYAKFMLFCKEKSVEVKASDTTGQINEKYGAKYPAEAADVLRGIYVRARYGNKTVSKELAEESYSQYRRIKNDVQPRQPIARSPQ